MREAKCANETIFFNPPKDFPQEDLDRIGYPTRARYGCASDFKPSFVEWKKTKTKRTSDGCLEETDFQGFQTIKTCNCTTDDCNSPGQPCKVYIPFHCTLYEPGSPTEPL